MTTALLIIDMQIGSFTPRAKCHDTDGLITRLNALAVETRARNGRVIIIQHDGPPGDDFHPDAPGWRLLPDLEVKNSDTIVHKQSCDSFLHTELDQVLKHIGATKLIITGSATDYCVDTTVRSALARGWPTIVPTDGHTCANRPHLAAVQIIAHHNAVWSDFISPAGPARLATCATALAEAEQAPARR
jgi:nicotinamidase-related amidase